MLYCLQFEDPYWLYCHNSPLWDCRLSPTAVQLHANLIKKRLHVLGCAESYWIRTQNKKNGIVLNYKNYIVNKVRPFFPTILVGNSV